MILKAEIFPIGKINKPHGIHGEMSFTFTTDVFDSEDVQFFVIEVEGIFVPFFIESYRFKTDTTGLLKLDGINSEEMAREFSGLTLYLPNNYLEKVDEDDITMDYFVGFSIVDEKTGDLGKVTAIEESTENVLFIIQNNNDELLIPANDDFILDIDHKEKKIYMQIPEGLLDL